MSRILPSVSFFLYFTTKPKKKKGFYMGKRIAFYSGKGYNQK